MLLFPLVIATSQANRLKGSLDYTINTLTNSVILDWKCLVATSWDTLDIDFNIKLEEKSVLDGSMSMKWNKNDCIEKKESVGIVTRLEPKVGFGDCFHPKMVTSKVPCGIGSGFGELFTFELEKEFLTCLDKGILEC
jgi:hypothetical protein